jgi:hexosaminidase
MITRSLNISLALAIVSSACTAQIASESNLTLNHIIPKPLSISRADGKFELKSNTTFYYTKDALTPIGVFTTLLKNSTGINFKTAPLNGERPGMLFIVSDTLNSLGEEGYKLKITPQSISVYAKPGRGFLMPRKP